MAGPKYMCFLSILKTGLLWAAGGLFKKTKKAAAVLINRRYVGCENISFQIVNAA